MPNLADPTILAFKAAAAVALALFVVNLAGLHDQLSATFAALVCTSPVVVTGMRRGLEQLVASLVGGLVTSGLLAVLPRHPATLGAAMCATILVTFRVGYARAYLVAGFTVLYVYIIPADTPGLALEHRLFSLLVGIAAASLVNGVASASFYRSIFARRVRILREAVAAACERLAACARDPARHHQAELAFDGVFPLLWALGAELSDARREGRLRSSVTRELQAFHDEVRALALLAHLGKELGLHLEGAPAEAEALALAASALGRSLVATDVVLATPMGAPAWEAAYRRAMEAANEARAAAEAGRAGRG